MSKKAFLLGALTGAVTGAVTALLLAPKSGRELRKDIGDTAVKVGEKTADLSRQAGTAVQSLAKRASGFATDTKEAAGKLFHSRKPNGAAAIEEGTETTYEYEDSATQ